VQCTEKYQQQTGRRHGKTWGGSWAVDISTPLFARYRRLDLLILRVFAANGLLGRYAELDMEWIHPWIVLDWIGLGGMTATPFFN